MPFISIYIKSNITPPACLLFSQRFIIYTIHSTASPLTFTDSLFVYSEMCWLADSYWWINWPTLFLSHSVFLSFFFSCENASLANRQTQVPAADPVIPVTFLISSELFSMPPVKRFSVSFARHPTNGMSAFIQVYFDTPPVFPVILHGLFVGKHFLCFLFLGVWRLAALITLNVSKI